MPLEAVEVRDAASHDLRRGEAHHRLRPDGPDEGLGPAVRRRVREPVEVRGEARGSKAEEIVESARERGDARVVVAGREVLEPALEIVGAAEVPGAPGERSHLEAPDGQRIGRRPIAEQRRVEKQVEDRARDAGVPGPELGQVGVDAGAEGLELGELLRRERRQDAFGVAHVAGEARRAVRADPEARRQKARENLAERAVHAAAHEGHLRDAVARLEVALGPKHVEKGLAVDMPHAARVLDRADRRREAREREVLIGLEAGDGRPAAIGPAVQRCAAVVVAAGEGKAEREEQAPKKEIDVSHGGPRREPSPRRARNCFVATKRGLGPHPAPCNGPRARA